MLSFQQVVNIIINEIFYILINVSLQNLICILHLQHISIQTSHISGAQ